ncbi:FecR family protein [Steroidobacter flavus]|uniref:FecR family protein n=1 Tax=Steroidobacter flavus TaxID=1842136 RepID=A0ABV8T370_9GAMM
MSAAPSIDEQAVNWLIRRDAGPLDVSEQENFDRWLLDPKHARAYRRAQSMWSDVSELPEKLPVEAQTLTATSLRLPKVESTRWLWARRATTALAAALAIAVVVPQLALQWRADEQTRVGEIRSVKLPDGSTITLNTDSAVTYEFTDNARTLHLLTGEAAFEVAADARRPFIVEANGGRTRALGTVFTVKIDADDVQVIGIEHSVEVTYSNSTSSLSRTLHPGERIRYGSRLGMASIQEAEPTADSWRRGRLIVENQRLDAVVDELNRYHRGHIQLLGADLGALQVNGVFPLQDMDASLAALEQSLGLEATSIAGYFVFLSAPGR